MAKPTKPSRRKKKAPRRSGDKQIVHLTIVNPKAQEPNLWEPFAKLIKVFASTFL